MIDGEQKSWGAFSALMGRPKKQPVTDPVALRLRVLQAAMDYDTDAAFAAFMGVSPQRWGNFLSGLPLSREMAFRLVEKVPGLSLDWLYFGNPAALSVALARRLEEAEGKLTKTA